MKTYHTSCLDCYGRNKECSACEGTGEMDYTPHELVAHALARAGWEPDDVAAYVTEQVPEADSYEIQEALNELSDADDAARKEFAQLHPWGL